MTLAVGIVLGTLAAIGALTLIAVVHVMRFGDEAMKGLMQS